MQPKAISGCAGGSCRGSAVVFGRRALHSSRRTQALVSSSDRRVASQSQVYDKCADNFIPYRRVISCDSDLDSLDFLAPSVSCSSVSPRSVCRVWGRASGVSAVCSRCCGAFGGGFGALCGVCSDHVSDWVITPTTTRGNTGLKLPEEHRR